MKKKILCLAASLILMLSMSINVLAEDFEGSKEWTVSFNGEKMDSNFKSAEMTEDILNILPGDSITLQVNLKNVDDEKSDWYMTNEVLQTLEESNTSAEGGAYTYILTYVDPAGGETVLYSSEVVGGEDAKEEEGLHQATNGLEDYFYLGRLAKDEQAVIRLYVQLDGETQGNAYQDTLAKLQMNFAVESVGTETVVKTGDQSPIAMISMVALGCALVLLVLAILAMHMNRKKGEQQ
ncbi:MAG: hypothetical protein IJN10_09360 [Firmicutes bacterium]|nr:hypothetical protein [Bacillota bacterium]